MDVGAFISMLLCHSGWMTLGAATKTVVLRPNSTQS